MTFSRFFFNPGIMRQNLRQHGWLGIVYALGLLFALPLQMLLGHNPYADPTELDNLFQVGSSVQMLLYLTVPIAAGLFLFRYLQAKAPADHMHSLPLRRKHLLTANLASGLLLLLLPIWLTAGVTACLLPWDGSMYIFTGAQLWNWTLSVTLLNILLYTFSVFVSICTGQTILSGIVTYILLLLPTALGHMLKFHFSMYIYGYPYSSYTVNRSAEGWSPFLKVMNQSVRPYSGLELAVYAAAAVLCVGFSYFLYTRRKVEQAGQAIAFTYFNPLFKAGVMLCAMLVAGNYFAEMKESHLGWTLAGYAIGAAIGYLLSEMVIRKTWQMMSRRIPLEFAVYGAVLALLLYIPGSSFTGYEAKVPAPDQVKAVVRLAAHRLKSERL